MNQEQEYIKAFNNGYVLAEHEPKLIESISKNLSPSNIYLEGLLEGKKQVEFENERNVLKELEKMRSQSQNMEKGFGRE